MSAAPALPTLAITGDLRDALAPRALGQLESDALTSWLRGRRWFGAKGARPTDARIVAAVRVPWGAQGAAIALLEVDVADGRTLRYQLPLTVRTGGAEDDGVLAEVHAGATRGVLVDAVEDAEFRRAMGAAFERGARFEEDGLTLVVEAVGGVSIPSLGAGKPGSAEQSNTSLRYGSAAILKLYRRLEAGENPDVEITRHLTATGRFGGTPPLLGTMRLELGEEAMTSGMLQRLVADASDGWSYALDVGRAYFADHGRVAPANAFVPEARKLGRLTGQMHAALAETSDDEAFAPRPVSRADVDEWLGAAAGQVERGLAMLEEKLRAGDIPAAQRADAESVVGARDAFVTYARRAAETVRGHAGLRVRHHGDYHLGQVLRDGEGRYWVIDFEGEPARPLQARRELHSALRDVAGMLRSFVYAAATLERDMADAADERALERHRVRADLWERAARDAFLEAYHAAAPSAVLPDTPERAAALLALFEVEKVFYELAYEVNNRPAWMWIPLRGILRLPVR